MKKLVIIALMFFMISIVVNAKKIDRRIFVELTKTMLVTSPTETVQHQNLTVSYWRIEKGGFYYITSKQEFYGKYKSWNFNSTSKATTILGVGVDKKNKKHIERNLLSDIISSRY